MNPLSHRFCVSALLAGLSLAATNVYAFCEFPGRWGDIVQLSGWTTIRDPANARPGEVIAETRDAFIPRFVVGTNCLIGSSTGFSISNHLGGGPIDESQGIFNSLNSGVGFRLWINNSFPMIRGQMNVAIQGRTAYYEDTSIRVQLVRTNQPLRDPTGLFANQNLGSVGYYNDTSVNKQYFHISLGEPYVITSTSCSVSSETVPLGDVNRSIFTSPGTTSPEKAFNVTVNCGTARPRLSLYMNSTTLSSAFSQGVMGLNPNGSPSDATGVGIQVLDGNTSQPVQFNQPRPVGPYGPGPMAVPFKARYYQLDNAVKAGRANGLATVTLAYE